ncbi:MAG: hypothetical protein FIA89_09125 [Geobacter sp.]|nr:hypothetical protein [Geobacter sp.]
MSYILKNNDIEVVQSEQLPVYCEGSMGWLVDGNQIYLDTNREYTIDPPVVPVQPDITVSPVEFMLLFTSPERIFIKSIRQSDPVVSDFMDIIEHPKLTFVNLSLASTQQAVDYLLSKLVEATVITAEDAPVRREAILSGSFQ